MALSEEEQKLLAQMEAALAAEDPKLEHALRGIGSRRIQGRKALVSLLGFVLGIALLLGGLQISWVVGRFELNWIVSVAGFLVMLGAAILALRSWTLRDTDNPNGGNTAVPPKRPSGDHPFMDKMEERWRRRQEGNS